MVLLPGSMLDDEFLMKYFSFKYIVTLVTATLVKIAPVILVSKATTKYTSQQAVGICGSVLQ